MLGPVLRVRVTAQKEIQNCVSMLLMSQQRRYLTDRYVCAVGVMNTKHGSGAYNGRQKTS